MTEPPDVTVAVARTLQALRADRGWSLDQLAARSGVSKGVLVAVEQGRSNPNLATLAKIADAFGVPVTRLVDMSGEPAVHISDSGRPRPLARSVGRDGHDPRRDRPAVGGGTLALGPAAG